MNQPAKQAESKWCARVLGRELGPMSVERLQRMLRDGEITPDDEVRRSHESTWSSAATFVQSTGADSFEILEPVVSSIAPLRIPKRKSDERIALIRERALAAQAPGSDLYRENEDVNFDTLRNDPELPDELAIDPGVDSELDGLTPLPNQDEMPQSSVSTAVSGPLAEMTATPTLSSKTTDGFLQGIGKSIRARRSRMKSSGPTLFEALGELMPRRWATPTTGIVAACLVVVCGLFWLMTPSYQGTAFERMCEIRTSVQNAKDDAATWNETMSQVKPEVTEIAERMKTVANAENPASQILLWATDEMVGVVSGSSSEAESGLKKYDQLISEYNLLTTGKDPVSN